MRFLIDWTVRLLCVGVVVVFTLATDTIGIVSVVGVAIAIFVAQLIIIGIGTLIDKPFARMEQAVADSRAKAIVQRVLLGHYPSAQFALYLRSFLNEGRVEILADTRQGTPGMLSPSKYTIHETESIEKLIRRVLMDMSVEPIMLGRRRFVEGPGCVEVSDPPGWRSVFEKVAKTATVIVCLPGSSPALLDELKHLVDNDLLRKCVFIEPSKDTLQSTALRTKVEEYGARWSLLRRVRVKVVMAGDEGGAQLASVSEDELIRAFHDVCVPRSES